jgi:hypothetical protein
MTAVSMTPLKKSWYVLHRLPRMFLESLLTVRTVSLLLKIEHKMYNVVLQFLYLYLICDFCPPSPFEELPLPSKNPACSGVTLSLIFFLPSATKEGELSSCTHLFCLHGGLQ